MPFNKIITLIGFIGLFSWACEDGDNLTVVEGTVTDLATGQGVANKKVIISFYETSFSTFSKNESGIADTLSTNSTGDFRYSFFNQEGYRYFGRVPYSEFSSCSSSQEIEVGKWTVIDFKIPAHTSMLPVTLSPDIPLLSEVAKSMELTVIQIGSCGSFSNSSGTSASLMNSYHKKWSNNSRDTLIHIPCAIGDELELRFEFQNPDWSKRRFQTKIVSINSVIDTLDIEY